MKKIAFLLSMALLIGFASCDGLFNKNKTDYKKYDMAILENGHILFYKAENGDTLRFEAETDSVVSAVYAGGDLYYTAAVDGRMFLKCLRLAESEPMPVQLADLNLKLEDVVGYEAFPIDNMFANADESAVVVESGMVYMFNTYSDVTIYDIGTGQLRKETVFSFDPETGMSEDFEIDLEAKPYPVIGPMFDDDMQGSLYYTGGSEKVCISDKIDYAESFGVEPEELEGEEYYSEPLTLSPDGQRVLFQTVLPWGDFGMGSYCVASLDGKQQYDLHSDIFYKTPEWLKDGSLVFIQDVKNTQNDGPTATVLMQMLPDGTTKKISDSPNYAVKPY